MATLYITEVTILPRDIQQQTIPAPYMPPIAEQTVAISGASTQSAAFNTNTRFILVNCDATCSLAFGPNPSAVLTAHRMPANETRFYGVNPGDKIAVISNS